MQLVKISVDGHAQEIQVAFEFDTNLVSEKDWLVSAELSYRGVRISPDDVSWKYSASSDVNFVYLVKTRGVSSFVPPSLTSEVPFDEVRFNIVPWSRSAEQSDLLPEIQQCRYAVRGVRIIGETMDVETHVMGSQNSGGTP